ncbi:hypothetical protein CsSME_00024704 [Camellia sinensis var. sinensis]
MCVDVPHGSDTDTHWTLLDMTADCQLFVATCSPARDSGAGYVAWGHSTLNIPSISEAKARGFVPVGRCFEAEFHGTQVTKFRNCQVREDAEF